MKVMSYPICDTCSSPILLPPNGYIIQGNIYTAQLDSNENPTAGLIGNNIEKKEDVITEIHKTCMCKSCFLKAIGLQSTTR